MIFSAALLWLSFSSEAYVFFLKNFPFLPPYEFRTYAKTNLLIGGRGSPPLLLRLLVVGTLSASLLSRLVTSSHYLGLNLITETGFFGFRILLPR